MKIHAGNISVSAPIEAKGVDQMASSKSLTVKPVRNGRGIVAAKPFRQGAVIVEIKGKIVTADEVWRYWEIDPRLGENCIRYDEDHYLDPNGEIGQHANHSCNPNAGIVRKGRRLILKAIASIAAWSRPSARQT